jgi:hypothetical protein
MDSHAAFATELLERDGEETMAPLVDELKLGAMDAFDPKMRALLNIASVVRRNPLELTTDDVAAATSVGATDGDVQLAVCIASAFSMYNRLVDGLRAMTPPVTEPYAEPARRIAEHGYSGRPIEATTRSG